VEIREDLLKRLSEEYYASVVQHRDQILGAAALVLLRVEAMSGEGWRNFLIIIFSPERDEVLPKVLVYHDNRCAYCGKELTTSRLRPVEKIECIVCGKEVPEDEEVIVCVDGHYICDKCYNKDTAKILIPLTLEAFIRNYELIKELVRKKLENKEYDDLPTEHREAIAFRDTVYSVYREMSKLLDRKMEITLLTNALIPDWFAHFASCGSRCEGFCQPALKILRRLGVVEG